MASHDVSKHQSAPASVKVWLNILAAAGIDRTLSHAFTHSYLVVPSFRMRHTENAHCSASIDSALALGIRRPTGFRPSIEHTFERKYVKVFAHYMQPRDILDIGRMIYCFTDAILS